MNCTSQRVNRAKQRLKDESYATNQKKLTFEENAAHEKKVKLGTQTLTAVMSVITMTNGPYSKIL